MLLCCDCEMNCFMQAADRLAGLDGRTGERIIVD